MHIFADLLSTDEALGVCRKLMDLLLKFGLPLCIGCDAGVYRRSDTALDEMAQGIAGLRAREPPKSSRGIERLGRWLQEVLS